MYIVATLHVNMYGIKTYCYIGTFKVSHFYFTNLYIHVDLLSLYYS